MASVKISKISKKSSDKVKQQPIVKNDKFDLWGVFKSFVLVGGDLV